MENRLQPHQYGRPLRPTSISQHVVAGSLPRPTVRSNQPSMSPVLLDTEAVEILDDSVASPSTPKRPRKERGPNWLPVEILLLIRAKRDWYLQELDAVDARDLMTTDNNKWTRVSNLVMAAGLSPCVRDGPACKGKWTQVVSDYKHITDYLGRTGQNVPDYWDLTSAQRKSEGLPRQFPQEFFNAIHEWYGSRPQIRPPHSRDLLSPTDSNFKVTQGQNVQGRNVDSDTETDDPFHAAQSAVPLSTDGSSPQQSPVRSSSTAARRPQQQSQRALPPSTAFTSLPPGVTPHVISSSDTTSLGVQGRQGNTAVRRKNISGHAIIADATKATGTIMASQMKEIADASLQVERSKIDVQLKLFSEQMAYHRERDRRLHESAMVAHENARLAIMKQNEMVHCLTQLTNVLGTGLRTHSPSRLHSMQPTAQTGGTAEATALVEGDVPTTTFDTDTATTDNIPSSEAEEPLTFQTHDYSNGAAL